MHIGFNLRQNVQFYRFRTFQCEQSKTHQNGRVDANRSMRFRWQRISVERALDWQNNNSARTCNHALLNISLQPLYDYDVKISTFTVYEEPEHEKTGERTSERILLEFNSRKIRQHLTNWTKWNRREEVWSSANSLFVKRFCCRRRCLSSILDEGDNTLKKWKSRTNSNRLAT